MEWSWLEEVEGNGVELAGAGRRKEIGHGWRNYKEMEWSWLEEVEGNGVELAGVSRRKCSGAGWRK